MIDWMMQHVTISRVAVLPLTVILLTAVYGLNEMRMTLSGLAFDRHTFKELCLSASYIALASSSGLMLWGVFHGIEVITWRGAVLIGGFAGLLYFVGKFQPWRRWLRRTVPIERQWRDAKRPTSEDLAEMVAECRRAVRYGADECLRVLPKVIAALEVLAAERLEMEKIRLELMQTVEDLRYRFRMAQTLSPATVTQMDDLLDRLQQAMSHD